MIQAPGAVFTTLLARAHQSGAHFRYSQSRMGSCLILAQ